MGHDVVAKTHQKEDGSTMQITTVGLDIAKSVFHFVGVNQAGKLVRKKMLRRKDLLQFLARLEPCLVVMEACGGANYWAREFQKLGHEVKLIAPQYVVPYRQGNKTTITMLLLLQKPPRDQTCALCGLSLSSSKMFRCFTECGRD